jgi:hypothetical protein
MRSLYGFATMQRSLLADIVNLFEKKCAGIVKVADCSIIDSSANVKKTEFLVATIFRNPKSSKIK